MQTPALTELLRLYPPLRTFIPTEILERLSVPQLVFLLDQRREAFYGGAVGGGKSAALLAGALEYVDRPGYAALLLRRTFPELEGAEGLIYQSHDWIGDNADWNEQKKRWTFESGAVLQFGHLSDAKAMFRYQGQAYQYVGFDELTHFTEEQYEYIAFSRQRRTLKHIEAGIPIRVRSASNPGGVGHGWVRSRFIDEETRRPGVVFIPAKVRDNPGLDANEYEQSLSHLPDALRRQLMDGDWGAFLGAAFQIDPSVHVVPELDPPLHWDRFESMDHGIGNPTAWLLWAVDTDGNLLVADEYYDVQPTVAAHATAIKKLRADGWERKDEDGWTMRNPVYGDPSIRNRTGGETKIGDPASTVTEYADNEISLALGNNDPRAGLARLRGLLAIDSDRPFPQWHPHYGETGSPRLFISSRCVKLLEQIASAPLQPAEKRLAGEIIDPDWESAYGHAVAAARYGAMSRAPASKEPADEPGPDATPDELRTHAMKELLERRRKRPDPADYYLNL